MNSTEYATCQVAIIQIGKQVSRLPLEAFLKVIDNSEKISRDLDPKVRDIVNENLITMKKLAEAFIPVQAAIKVCEETVFKNTPKTVPIEVKP